MSCGAARPTSAGAAAHPAPPSVGSGPVPSGSARRVTSVLFGDLVGFTSLAEGRDQEEVRELLSAYFDACRTVIDRYGGTVEKFIGDAVMAVWGAPVAYEDDAERAVRAGLELVEAVAVLGERVGVPGLSMRVGIVTGEVAVTVGARGQGMVAGDPVNTAARVQTVAAAGTVWVDESTRQLTQSAVTFADMGARTVKGKEVPLRLWQAVAVVGTVGGGQRADGLEAAMVGRERELRLVKDLFHDTESSRSPSMLLVSGGPGLGKTRLGWEFSKYTDGLSGAVRWLEARCSAYGQAPFHALADAFRGRLRALDGTGGAALDGTGGPGQDGGAGLEDLLDRFLEQWVPDPAERPWLRARTATLLGLSGAHGYPREELFGAWVTVLEKMAIGAEAMVLLVDDAQYADAGLLDFLEFSLAARDLPLLVVLLTRPELLGDRPDWLTNPRIVTTHLRELSHAEMTRLVASLVEGLDEEVSEGLVERAAGVPLFAIETVGALIDQGLVTEQDGGGHLQVGDRLDIASLPAPLSLQALIASRLDLLPRDLRTVVDLASVLGASFTPGLLADLADPDVPAGSRADAVRDALASLVQRQVLRLDVNPLSPTYGAYSFVQDVARQVAYSMLARRDRRAIHLQVADLLEEHVADAELPVIASHLAAALASVPEADDTDQLRERTVAAYEAAGDWARRLGAWTDADIHYQHGVDLTDDPLRQATLLARIAEVYVSGADAERGIACGRTGLDLAARVGNEVLEATLAGIVGLLHGFVGEHDEAVRLVDPYWEAFKDRTDADDAVRWLARARRAAFLSPGDRGQMADVLLGLAQRTRRPEDLALALNSLATRFTDMGFLDAARLIVADALEVAREHDLRSEQASVLSSLSLLESREDTHASTLATRASLDLARDLHLHEMTRVNVANLSICYLELGRWGERDDLLAADLEILAGPLLEMVDADTAWVEIARGQTPTPVEHAPVDPDIVLVWDLARAAVRAARGERDGVAEQVLDTMRAARRAIDTTVELIDGGLTKPGEILVDLGDADALETLLEEHCTIPDTGAPTVVLGSRERFRGHLARLRTGPTLRVVEHQRAAVAQFVRLGADLYTMRARHDLAAALHGVGEHDEAAALRTQVGAFYESLGATAWLGDLHRDAGART